MDQTVYAAQVDEYAVRGDVFNGSFEDLAFFEFADDVFFLLFEFGFDEGFMRHNHVAEFLVDFDHFEFHGFVDIDIVVADRFHVDLRTGQEGFDTENIDDHTALGAALDVTLDDFVFFERFVDAIPRAELTGFLVREDQLTFFVFGRFHIHFHFVTDFEVGVVAEFAAGDHPFGFETDVHEHFAFVDRGNGTFHYFASLDVREGLVVLFGDLFFRFATVNGSFGFKCVPVELIDGDRGVRRFLSLRFFCVCSHFVVCWNETKRVRHYVLTPCNSTRLPKGVAKVRYFFNLQAVADIFPGTKHLVAVFCWRPEIFADNIFGTEGRPRSGTR